MSLVSASFSTICIATFVLVSTVYAFDAVRAYLRHSRLVHEHGCQQPKFYPHKEPFLGLDLFFNTIRSTKERRRMEFSKQLFDQLGQTWQSVSFGKKIVNSIDPDNLKSVLATDFDSWGLAPLRYPAASPFMGRGVFTSDGPFWQHARAQVKPILIKAQFVDFKRFDRHLTQFISLMPRNGATVDVLPLLERLVLIPSHVRAIVS